MEALITYIVKALVDRPDQVSLRQAEAEGAQLFELHVAQEDVGKVIGRDGRTINALRTLLSVAALRKGVKARLEIADDRRGPASPRPAEVTPEPGGGPTAQ